MNIARQVQQTLRSLGRSPGFTLVSVAILAIGIGANATVFTLVSRLFFQPPPGVDEPDRLVRAIRYSQERPAEWWSYPDYEFFRDHGQVFQGLAAYYPVPLVLSAATGESPVRAKASLVSSNYFDVLSVRPAAGRGFVRDDARAVAVLSHGFWKRVSGGALAVGGVLRLNGHPFTVVGIAPPELQGVGPAEEAPDVWVPLTARPVLIPDTGPGWLDRAEGREVTWLQVIGRLRPDASLASAQANMEVVSRDFSREYASSAREGQGVRLSSSFQYRPDVYDQLARLSRLLMGIVALVLIIASTNVAILLLARATARRKEYGIRLSLGASRRQVASQLLAEGLLLSLAGAVAGFLLAFWSADLAARLLPFDFAIDFTPDARVLMFTLCAAAVAAVLAAVAPALRAAGMNPASLIKTGDPGSGRLRLLDGLVTLQIALSIVLVTGAVLFLRSFQAAQAVELGFETKGRLLVSVDLGQHGYSDEEFRRFVDQARDRLSALPGARQVSTTLFAPFGGMWGNDVQSASGRKVGSSLNAVGEGYFKAMGIPLLAGRDFTERDGAAAPRVAVVNQEAAEKLWPGGSPLGSTARLGDDDFTVVGIARNAQYHELGESPVPHIYFPARQTPQKEVTFLLETEVDPLTLAAPAERALQAVDPEVAIAATETMEEAVGRVTGRYRVGAILVTLFALLALILAAAGLYGVMSYSVAQRKRSIGIQMALGATADRVLGLVLARGLRLTAIGAVLGLAVAWTASRLVSGFLFGIEPSDLVSFLIVPLVLGIVACLASLLPAFRAARVDPIEVLR